MSQFTYEELDDIANGLDLGIRWAHESIAILQSNVRNMTPEDYDGQADLNAIVERFEESIERYRQEIEVYESLSVKIDLLLQEVAA